MEEMPPRYPVCNDWTGTRLSYRVWLVPAVEEGWLGGAPFYGGYGLLTVNGVAKPAYRAFQMLNTAGDQRLPVKIQVGQPF